MAAGLGHVKAAELLSVAEAAATVNLQAQRAQHADDPCRPHRPAARCPECDEVINLGQIRRIEGRVADNDESNLYVREFAQSGAAAALKCEVWCVRALSLSDCPTLHPTPLFLSLSHSLILFPIIPWRMPFSFRTGAIDL